MNYVDEVIRKATEASEANSYEVRRALTAYIASPDDTTKHYLRIALVSQAAGHEGGSHDGSTYEARKKAAQEALEAWDRVPDKETRRLLGWDK